MRQREDRSARSGEGFFDVVIALHGEALLDLVGAAARQAKAVDVVARRTTRRPRATCAVARARAIHRPTRAADCARRSDAARAATPRPRHRSETPSATSPTSAATRQNAAAALYVATTRDAFTACAVDVHDRSSWMGGLASSRCAREWLACARAVSAASGSYAGGRRAARGAACVGVGVVSDVR